MSTMNWRVEVKGLPDTLPDSIHLLLRSLLSILYPEITMVSSKRKSLDDRKFKVMRGTGSSKYELLSKFLLSNI